MTAYEKMKVAQGSLIPYFYGAHKVKFVIYLMAFELTLCQFRLRDGHEDFGILLEYVQDAETLESGVAGNLNEEQRGELVR